MRGEGWRIGCQLAGFFKVEEI
ncbi:hypothetical protein VULLAG_LOCUS10870 [Vulpes lagopus]